MGFSCPNHCSQCPNFINYIKEILSFSSIHGVKYLPKKKLHLVERIFWTCAILSALGITCYWLIIMSERLVTSPVITTFQSEETPIISVPFPAVTVCNVNMLKRDEMVETIKWLIEEEENQDLEGILKALSTVGYLAQFCWSAESFRQLIQDVELFAGVGFPGLQANMTDASLRLEKIYLNASYLMDSNLHKFLSGDLHAEYEQLIIAFTNRASHRCEDMLWKCIWESRVVECGRIFHHVLTVHGVCCAFNMMPSFVMRKLRTNSTREKRDRRRMKLTPEDIADWEKFGEMGHQVWSSNIETNETDNNRTTLPRSQSSGGKPYGLSIILNPELDSYSSCTSNDAFGFKVTIHSPVSSPNVMDYGVAVPPNSGVFLNIEPDVTYAAEGLEFVDIEKRGCYFRKDKESQLKSYKFYSSSNCMDECLATHTFANCSCVRHYMPVNSTLQICGAKEIECANEVRANLGKSQHLFCGHCLPSCTETKYNNIQESHFPLTENDADYYRMLEDPYSKPIQNLSILHVFMGAETLYAKERRIFYKPLDILYDVGGLVGLTLGMSLISVMELVYFCTLRIWFRFCCKPSQHDEDDYYKVERFKVGRRRPPKLSAIVHRRLTATTRLRRRVPVTVATTPEFVPGFKVLRSSKARPYPYLS